MAQSPIATLNLTLINAQGLKDTELFGRSDPYCTVELLSLNGQPQQKMRTKTAKNAGTSPVWNQVCKLQIMQHHVEVLINIYDENFTSDDFLGTVRIPLTSLHNAKSRTFTLPVIRKGKQKGTLTVSATYSAGGERPPSLAVQQHAQAPVAATVSYPRPQGVPPTTASAPPQAVEQKYYPGITFAGGNAVPPQQSYQAPPGATPSTLPYYNPPQQQQYAPPVSSSATSYPQAAPAYQPSQPAVPAYLSSTAAGRPQIPVAYPTAAVSSTQPPRGYPAPAGRARPPTASHSGSSNSSVNYSAVYPPPRYN